MKTVTISDIKFRGAKALPKSGQGASYIIVNSKPQGVVLHPDEYEQIMELLEDLEDLQVAQARKNDELIEQNEFWATVNAETNN